MEGSGNGYLRTACDYVHLNPVRAGLLAPEDRLLAYPWSSFGLYLAAREHRPAWLRVDRLLGEHGIQQDTPGSRQEFERHMERRRLEEVDPEALEAFRRDWCLGSEAFRTEQLERMEGGLGQHHAGELRLETAQAKAERLVAEELTAAGVERGGLGPPTEERPGQTGHRGAATPGDHPDHQGHRRACSFGDLQHRKRAFAPGHEREARILWQCTSNNFRGLSKQSGRKRCLHKPRDCKQLREGRFKIISCGFFAGTKF